MHFSHSLFIYLFIYLSILILYILYYIYKYDIYIIYIYIYLYIFIYICRYWSWLSPLRGWGSLTMAFTGKPVYMAHHFILQRLNLLDLRVDRERWWFEHLCHSCGFACQQRVLKMFSGPGYLRSEEGVVWLWYLLISFGKLQNIGGPELSKDFTSGFHMYFSTIFTFYFLVSDT